MSTMLDRNRLRSQLQALSWRNGLLKIGELGGSVDTPFEQAFSNLAHAHIQDKASKLLPYEVGFQLIEKNDDNTRAVGVFGFKLGTQWLYTPIFFLNGELKGHELLYIKNQDMFVPLKENWINYLMGKKPSILGEGMNRNLSMVGVMPPNLYQMSKSPSKFASAAPGPSGEMIRKCSKCGKTHKGDSEVCPHCGWKHDCPMKCAATPPRPPYYCPKCHCDWHEPTCSHCGGKNKSSDSIKMAGWAAAVLPAFAHTALADYRLPDSELVLPRFLKEAGEPMLRFLVEKVGRSYPKLLQSIDACYGPEMLTGLARSFAADRQKAASTSWLKKAVQAETCEHPPGWNGTYSMPSAVNGGKMTTGVEAWNSSHVGRRFEKRHGGAQKGTIQDLLKAGSIMQTLTKQAAKPKGYGGAGDKTKAQNAMTGDPRKKGRGVSVTTYSEVMGPGRSDLLHLLSDKDKEHLIRERVVIHDSRDDREVTIAYDVQTQLKLQNPDRTNVYLVLTAPDKFEACLVIFGPYSHRGAHVFCTVVSLKDGRRWINIHPTRVWVHGELDDEAWRKWWETQPDAKSLPDSGLFCVVLPWGQGTVPCEVVETYDVGADDSKLYDVRFRDWADVDQPFYHFDYDRPYRTPPTGAPYKGSRIRLTGLPGKKIRVTEGEMWVPEGAKVFKLKKAEKGPDGDEDSDDRSEDSASQSQPPPMQLGTPEDVMLAIARHTTPMHVMSRGGDVTLDENRKLQKDAALKHLIVAVGLREKAAHDLLTASKAPGGVRVLLKFAEPNDDMITAAPNAPPFPEPNIGWDPMTGSNVPTMSQSEYNTKIPDMSASRTDRSIYQPQGPDPNSMAVAQEAAQTGQKEVFDTAMLGSLLKTVGQGSMVDRYLGDLMRGLDRLGRIKFQLLWHGEEFEERYSKKDMPELEDALQNSFEGLGEVVLKLKQKGVDPYNDDATADLTNVSHQ